MRTQSFIRFASEDRIIAILIKERVKWIGKTEESREYSPVYKELCRILPARRTWVTPCKKQRSSLRNERTNQLKNAATALKLTLARDRSGICRRKEGNKDFSRPGYIPELIRFIADIIETVSHCNVTLSPPKTTGIFKKKEDLEDKVIITFRPISVYEDLKTKVLIKLASEYLTSLLDPLFHEEILSYRQRRDYHGEHPKEKYMTKADDAIPNIQRFRQAHDSAWVAECDIKKFYDIIPHSVVRDCFRRLFDRTTLTDNGKEQVMRLLDAYLNSYNFYEDAWLFAEQHDDVYNKIRSRLHDAKRQKRYQLGWVEELLNDPQERKGRGVPQGGSLSLLIANIVLNDVDQPIVTENDPNRLFIRYCDDMILLHTDREECQRLMNLYTQSLEEHGLYYHPFIPFDRATNPAHDFWKAKSHRPFLWGEGEGNSNRYIGFLGYELHRDGKMRLRKDNVMRFKEKFRRLYYALRRYKEKHSEEKFAEHQTQTFEKALSMAFYTAFDQETFKKGSQYRYMTKLKERTVKRLAKVKVKDSKKQKEE